MNKRETPRKIRHLHLFTIFSTFRSNKKKGTKEIVLEEEDEEEEEEDRLGDAVASSKLTPIPPLLFFTFSPSSFRFPKKIAFEL